MPAPKKNPLTNLIKKGAKKAVVKVKPKPNLKAEPKSNVKKVAGKTKTAPKTGLENRGAKLTKRERSERAAGVYFDKQERRWEGEYLTRATGLRGPKGVTSQRTRGPGARSLRKDEAIKKEVKRIIKIKSK